jgi:hypothetical protein
MNTQRSALMLRMLLATGFLVALSTSRAELKQFSIDPWQSSLTVSGTFAGFPIEPQSPGSLTTRYSGMIEADVTTSSILFWGGSLIAARTDGTWQPGPGGVAGSAPGDYGGQVVNLLVSGLAALRKVVFDVASDELQVTGGRFDSLGLRFSFVPGSGSVIDYTYTSLLGGGGSGSPALTGISTNNAATNATPLLQGDEAELFIPVDISGSLTVASPNDVQYRFRGQLVARASAPTPLQINSFQVNPGQLRFLIATVPGQTYSILGSTKLTDWPEVLDQFTATNSPSERIVALPAAQRWQFFRVRSDLGTTLPEGKPESLGFCLSRPPVLRRFMELR